MQTLMKLCLNGFVGFYVIRFNMLSDAFLAPVLTKKDLKRDMAEYKQKRQRALIYKGFTAPL